jgi:hypothetical protein
VTTLDDAFEYIDALQKRLEAIEFDRLAQGLTASPWRRLSFPHFSLIGTTMELQLQNEGWTALNQLRFDAFVRKLQEYGIAEDGDTPLDPDQRSMRDFDDHLRQQLAWERTRRSQVERQLLEARRQIYRHTDDEVLDALRAIDDGCTKASQVADHLWRGKAPHHFVIRVGLALGRLRDGGQVRVARPCDGYGNRWAVQRAA